MKIFMRLLMHIGLVSGFAEASEYFKQYDINQPRTVKRSTQRALEYERAYNKDQKERTAGLYNKFKRAFGFKSAVQLKPRVAEYEAAFSPYSEQRNAPWNTPWYEKRTYDEPLPENVKKALDEHRKELTEMENTEEGSVTVSSFEWLPGYVVKKDPYRRYLATGELLPGDPNRIKGAKAFMRDIKAQQNPMIYVPQKYPYTATSSGDPRSRVGSDYIISEKVPISNEPITKEEAKAIAKMAYRTKWTDPHSRNLIKMAPGRIAIIDTDPHFRPEFKKHELKERIDTEMLRFPKPLSPEAVDYLKNKQLESQYKNRGWHILVPPSRKNFYSRMGL